jgi:hypothetical protein
VVSNKVLVIVVVAIAAVVILLPIYPKSIPVSVSYQVPSEVPLKYTYTQSYSSVGILEWELQYTCTITNVDTVGGTFTVQANFKDGTISKYSVSGQNYIGSGQKATFQLSSKGLSYSTDWQTRYTVSPSITPSTKIEYHTGYWTEYQTKYVNLLGLFG